VTFENSPVFVTAGHPGHARDGWRARRIAEVPPAGGREDAVIKLGELVMILDLHRQGLSVSAIARQMGVDRKTVRNYLAKGLEPPTYKEARAGARRRRSLRSLFARAAGGLSGSDRATSVP
jgi:hypothetical protein